MSSLKSFNSRNVFEDIKQNQQLRTYDYDYYRVPSYYGSKGDPPKGPPYEIGEDLVLYSQPSFNNNVSDFAWYTLPIVSDWSTIGFYKCLLELGIACSSDKVTEQKDFFALAAWLDNSAKIANSMLNLDGTVGEKSLFNGGLFGYDASTNPGSAVIAMNNIIGCGATIPPGNFTTTFQDQGKNVYYPGTHNYALMISPGEISNCLLAETCKALVGQPGPCTNFQFSPSGKGYNAYAGFMYYSTNGEKASATKRELTKWLILNYVPGLQSGGNLFFYPAYTFEKEVLNILKSKSSYTNNLNILAKTKIIVEDGKTNPYFSLFDSLSYFFKGTPVVYPDIAFAGDITVSAQYLVPPTVILGITCYLMTYMVCLLYFADIRKLKDTGGDKFAFDQLMANTMGRYIEEGAVLSACNMLKEFNSKTPAIFDGEFKFFVEKLIMNCSNKELVETGPNIIGMPIFDRATGARSFLKIAKNKIDFIENFVKIFPRDMIASVKPIKTDEINSLQILITSKGVNEGNNSSLTEVIVAGAVIGGAAYAFSNYL